MLPRFDSNGHRASAGTPSGERRRPTGGRDPSLARRVAGRLGWPAPRRNPRLTSERMIAVRWVFIIENWYEIRGMVRHVTATPVTSFVTGAKGVV